MSRPLRPIARFSLALACGLICCIGIAGCQQQTKPQSTAKKPDQEEDGKSDPAKDNRQTPPADSKDTNPTTHQNPTTDENPPSSTPPKDTEKPADDPVKPAEKPAKDKADIPPPTPADDKDKPPADKKEPADTEPKEGDKKADDVDKEQAPDPDHPFARRIPVPDFPKDMTWLNTGGPLRKADLKGKFVLMDFWTYCCINCLHILPELKKLEKKYPNELVVIGVHSAKFETEKDSKNIAEAILRYEIEHPVVNDAEHRIWNTYGVQSWPTVLMIDPEGNAVWGTTGEIQFEDVDKILQVAVPYYRKKKLLDETPIRFDLLAHRTKKTPLRFPGKVLADEAGKRLFITDSNHNRIVIASLDGKLIDTIGTGAMGQDDGGYDKATFDHPQGVALNGQTLYVADTENHLLRKIDLEKKTVTTIAGVGKQGRNAWPGLEKLKPGDDLPKRWVGVPKETPINSPWALWAHKDQLYIAMAGPHQIWRMSLDEKEIGPYAGNGREDIVDGPLLPQQPYELGYSSFAQPSGLTSDGTWLYVADSEGSSIRAVPFDPNEKARTVIGSADKPYGRLFDFGDVDGERDKAKLQHALGVAYHDGKIYITDTYNNKVKIVDAKTGAVKTLAGGDKPGNSDEEGLFDEPAGIAYADGKLFVADTNNHAIRLVDPSTGKVQTLEIDGLTPPVVKEKPKRPTFPGATQVALKPTAVKVVDGKVTLAVDLKLPLGWKINDLAPMGYFVEAEGDAGSVQRDKLAQTLTRLEKPSAAFNITLPVSGAGKDTVKVSLNFYYCQEGGEGLCKVGSVTWTVPLEISDDGSATAKLSHVVQ